MGERVETFEAIRIRKDGVRFYVSLTLSSVKDSAGRIIGAAEIDRDITERKRLEQEVLQISERERRRIGQDLHDGLGQHLTGIAFLSKSLQQRLAAKSSVGAAATAEESNDAGRIAELVQQAVGQTRALARGLHPVEATANGMKRFTILQRGTHPRKVPMGKSEYYLWTITRWYGKAWPV